MKKRIVCIIVSVMFLLTSLTFSVATVEMNSEPILKIEINPKINVLSIYYSVLNIGDATAHNVTYSNISFEGNVLYNSKCPL